MATVKNKCLNIDDKAPVHVESEGERLIKQLAAKQTNTKTTLQEYVIVNESVSVTETVAHVSGNSTTKNHSKPPPNYGR